MEAFLVVGRTSQMEAQTTEVKKKDVTVISLFGSGLSLVRNYTNRGTTPD
jgi:hypothetical protein